MLTMEKEKLERTIGSLGILKYPENQTPQEAANTSSYLGRVYNNF